MKNERFKEIEDKLKIIISRCNEKTLEGTSSSEKFSISRSLNEAGIGSISTEIYNINGLYIYKVSSISEPIDYLMSDRPLFNKSVYINEEGYREDRYTFNGNSFLEFSKGGNYNSIGIKTTKGYKYTPEMFIGICLSDNSEIIPDLRVKEEDGNLQVDGAIKLGNPSNYVYQSRDKYIANAFKIGDLFGYINNVTTDRKDKFIVDQYRAIINKINSVSREIVSEEANKGKIKQLLSRKKEQPSDIDPFSRALTYKKNKK